MIKPPAKAATASKTSALPAKTAAKPAASATTTPIKPAAKAAPTPVKPAASATAAPVKPAASATAAPVKPAAKAPTAAKSSTPKQAPAPAPAVPTPAPAASNRFTDRFAPAARPAAPQMTETLEVPKPVQKIDPKVANAWKHKAGRELSEAELLAMPEAEFMKDKQLDFFRARLQQQKDDLLSNAGETTEHLREDTSIVPDPADRATIEEEHALELRTRDRERKLLKKIAQSLTRLDSGEYGYCDETGEPIGLPRLLARPTATLSLEAQQRRELKQKMFGD